MLCCLDQRNTIAAVRTVRRFTRHAADELSEPQEASLKYSGFLLSTAAQDLLRAPATRLRDDDEGQQTTGGTPRTVKWRRNGTTSSTWQNWRSRPSASTRWRGAGAAVALPPSFIHRAGDELIKAVPRERDADPRRLREPTPKRRSIDVDTGGSTRMMEGMRK